MLGRQRVIDKAGQVLELLAETLDRLQTTLGQHGGRQLVGARGAAHAQVDPARIERVQHAKALGHFQRTVVRQHHSA